MPELNAWIIAFTLLNVCEKFANFCQVLKKMHREENCFFLPHGVYHTHKHLFNGPLSGTTLMSWYQKGNTSLDFTEA